MSTEHTLERIAVALEKLVHTFKGFEAEQPPLMVDEQTVQKVIDRYNNRYGTQPIAPPYDGSPITSDV